jgi:hypothetical protein
MTMAADRGNSRRRRYNDDDHDDDDGNFFFIANYRFFLSAFFLGPYSERNFIFFL